MLGETLEPLGKLNDLCLRITGIHPLGDPRSVLAVSR